MISNELILSLIYVLLRYSFNITMHKYLYPWVGNTNELEYNHHNENDKSKQNNTQ